MVMKLPKDEVLVQRTIGIAGKMWREVKARARADGVTAAEWIRRAIDERMGRSA